MKVVYFLETGYYAEEQVLHGVFSSKEKAKEAMKKILADDDWYKEEDFYITEHEIDKVLGIYD